MATTTFDTLKALEGLEAVGMDARHAKAVVNTVAEAFSDTVATKADVAEVKVEIAGLRAATKSDVAALKADIAGLEARIDSGLANLRAEMFRALWIQGGGIVALIVGLLKFT